jgi:hypothetical protein
VSRTFTHSELVAQPNDEARANPSNVAISVALRRGIFTLGEHIECVRCRA